MRLVLIISREEFSTFLDTDDPVVETRDGKTKHCNGDFDVEGRVPVAHGTDGDAAVDARAATRAGFARHPRTTVLAILRGSGPISPIARSRGGGSAIAADRCGATRRDA